MGTPQPKPTPLHSVSKKKNRPLGACVTNSCFNCLPKGRRPSGSKRGEVCRAFKVIPRSSCLARRGAILPSGPPPSCPACLSLVSSSPQALILVLPVAPRDSEAEASSGKVLRMHSSKHKPLWEVPREGPRVTQKAFSAHAFAQTPGHSVSRDSQSLLDFDFQVGGGEGIELFCSPRVAHNSVGWRLRPTSPHTRPRLDVARGETQGGLSRGWSCVSWPRRLHRGLGAWPCPDTRSSSRVPCLQRWGWKRHRGHRIPA